MWQHTIAQLLQLTLVHSARRKFSVMNFRGVPLMSQMMMRMMVMIGIQDNSSTTRETSVRVASGFDAQAPVIL